MQKDQEGDAAAALSLYCKALDFFVPALRCKCMEPWGWQGWSAIAAVDGFQKRVPIHNFMGDRQRINLELSALEDSRGFGVGQGPHINHHCLQTKWIHSGRRQLRQRWVSKSPAGNR